MQIRTSIGILFLAVALLALSCHHKKKSVAKKPVAARPAKKPSSSAKSDENTHKLAHADELHQKLGLSEKEMAHSKLLLFVDDWYGVPYKYGGCQKTGIDCSCFTSLLCENVYHIKLARQASEMYKSCLKVPPEEMREGDLVFFKIEGNTVSHVGVYLRNRMFVHSSTSKGVVINSMDEAYYKKFFHAGGRLKAL